MQGVGRRRWSRNRLGGEGEEVGVSGIGGMGDRKEREGRLV